ncbi:hypothetical protein D9757_009300 [Collybiopsis confluens]|uniref:PUM-HD domain-containing protein n=1 Tax=Collybiopsis confluens TaxID=2823264 RepID=A0A8H5H3P1_9AGAR|nr:hypothetical protein D9757_009300 [Collybiopsis confluens]
MSTDIAPSAVFDGQPIPRSRQSQAGSGSLASIWAPQPQPSDVTWPKALDSFSREPDLTIKRPELPHLSSMPGLISHEDVFGSKPIKDGISVGAIGDGRKKVTPDFEPHTVSFSRLPSRLFLYLTRIEQHVEQLLRTLDLNSPDPYNLHQKPPLNLSLDSAPGTPDFSPVSMSSVLLTPTDLSPTRPLDLNSGLKQQLHSPFDVMAAGARANAFLTHQSSLFEPNSPTRPNNSSSYHLSSNQINLAAANSSGNNYPIISNASSYPIFRNYNHEQSSPTPLTAPSLPPAQTYALYHPSQVGLPTDHQLSSHQLYAAISAQNFAQGLPRRYADVQAAAGMPRSSVQALNGSDWHVSPQVGSVHPLLSQSALNLQLQLQQQQQHLPSNGDWLRTDEGPSIAHSIVQPSAASSLYANSSPLGLGLNLDPAPGFGIPVPPITTDGGRGLEDSIHAPSSLRSSTSSSSSTLSGHSSHQQHSQASIDSSEQQPHNQHRKSSPGSPGHIRESSSSSSHGAHEPINFLSLLHPSSSPPYQSFVSRIIKSSDQQASIFLQQKLKVADVTERAKILDAICARGFEMMAHRFGNWAVQRCLEAASTPEERKKIAACMRGRIVELATNCYGCHVLQKALDCEEDIRLLIVSELLLGDPAQTLVNKHASHVWSKIMELSWTPPAPPIFAYVNKSLKGKWAALACHETGSLVVQHAFENLEDDAKDGIVDELLNHGTPVFSEVAKNQWGSYCVQHILEHGSEKHRQLTLDHLINGLLEYATNEQGYKSITKALKEGGNDTLDRVVKRMCEPAKTSSRRAMVVDLALSVTGSQLIASVLPSADREQRALLYDCIRGHIVTLRGCKTGSKVIWLFDRMRAYYGY